MLYGLDVNSSTCGSVHRNRLTNLFIDLIGEFTSGAFQASQQCLELDRIFQPDFYTQLLLLRRKGHLCMQFTKKFSAQQWNGEVWHVEKTIHKLLTLKLAFQRLKEHPFCNCAVTPVTITAS